MPETSELHLAVALDGAGWHPAAWRSPDARPRELFSAGYWTDLAREAEAGTLDFLTIEDSLGLQTAGRFAGPDDRTDQVRGRLDAVLTAARIAPHTARIGLVPTAVTTHTEPFHLSTSIATLDYVSEGRAGWRPRVAASPGEARHFGRREFPRAHRGERHRPRRRRAPQRPVRRGRRRRRGRAAAVGLLGGRRGDPRRAGRPVRRPRQAALHRLRRPLVRRPRPVDHAPPAAGPARRRIARARRRGLPARRPRVRRGVRDPRQRGARRADRGGGPRRRESSGTSPAASPGLRRPRGVHRRGPGRRRGPQAPPRRPGRRGVRDRLRDRRREPPASWPTCCSAGARRGSTGSGSVPARCRTTFGRSPGRSSLNCAAAARSAPATRNTRCASVSACPAPLTDTGPAATRLAPHDQAGDPRSALPRGQQPHRVERPGGGQPDRVLLVRAPGADGRGGPVRLLLPGRRAAAARAARQDPRPGRGRPGPTR